MKTSMFLIFVNLIFSLATTAHADYQDPGVFENFQFQSSSVVRGAEPASANDVVSSSTVLIQTSSGGICSGTLIAADLVITAAHCVVGESLFMIQGSYKGTSVIKLGQAYRSHPKFSINKILMGMAGKSATHDIALIHLGDKFPAVFRPASLPAREVRYSEQKVVIAGYGTTFSSKDKNKKSDAGTLRFGAATVTSYKSGASIQLKENGKAYGCPGDSGGPLYTNSRDRLVIIGIHSWGNCDWSTANAESVGQHLQWINKAAEQLRSGAEM
ncbi:S1 family peptidase [Bdellovibrio bacteriovorus]|nr:trypsin-like serine protease [Bdellovibrio bacteriovorus]